MSVYTVVTHDSLTPWLAHYCLGQLLECKGIAAGVTNTNYFITTPQGRYVLTLFETLTLDKLPFYLHLMNHLSQHNIACPRPIPDQAGQFVSILVNKPACLTSCLGGQDVTHPNTNQCYAVGKMLARMHLAAADYTETMENPRGPQWCHDIASALYSSLQPVDQHSLEIEIEFQSRQSFSQLPAGIVHADLFRDNVLLEENQITGFIDFYYACNDSLLYDVAIAVNDWAQLDDGKLNDKLALAFIDGYQSSRPLTAAEKQAWPSMLRAAALRFWLSRLLDVYRPQPGKLTSTKDPKVFQRLLEAHRQRAYFWI